MVELNEDGEVRAAGGAVCRTGPQGLEVLLVHRPAYDDWTLPKGKVDPGETDEEAALREVEEETGITGTLVEELPTTRWHDRFGRPKVSRYWRIQPDPGARAQAQNEVDSVEWLDLERAAGRLTYPRDLEVLGALRAHGETAGR